MRLVQKEGLPLHEEVAHLKETLHARSALVATLHLLRQSIAFLTLATLVHLTEQKPFRVKKHMRAVRVVARRI